MIREWIYYSSTKIKSNPSIFYVYVKRKTNFGFAFVTLDQAERRMTLMIRWSSFIRLEFSRDWPMNVLITGKILSCLSPWEPEEVVVVCFCSQSFFWRSFFRFHFIRIQYHKSCTRSFGMLPLLLSQSLSCIQKIYPQTGADPTEKYY